MLDKQLAGLPKSNDQTMPRGSSAFSRKTEITSTFHFHKMHGLGNDFVIVDAREAAISIDGERARAIADRREGIGCDQLILLERSERADARMRIWNADGSEVEACGNASRCVAWLLGGRSSIETAAGLLKLEDNTRGATATLAPPRFAWNEIPLARVADTTALPLSWGQLQLPQAVNVGNPHAIFWVPDCDSVDLEQIGPIIENDPFFPDRVNVNIATVENSSRVRLRVWERGAGLTRACGTGACATAVAAIRSGKAKSPVTIVLPGGEIVIEWAPGGAIRMSGPVAYVFAGEASGL